MGRVCMKYSVVWSVYRLFCPLYANSCEYLLSLDSVCSIWVVVSRRRRLPADIVPNCNSTGLKRKAAAIPSRAALAIGMIFDFDRCCLLEIHEMD